MDHCRSNSMALLWLIVVGILVPTTPSIRAQSIEENLILDYEVQLDMNDPNESISQRNMLLKPLGYNLTSPYQALPGTYSSYLPNQYYQGQTPYKPRSIYSDYLNTGAYLYQSPKCANYYTKMPKVTQADVAKALSYANDAMRIRYPEYSNKSNYGDTSRKEIEAYMMELASEYFAKDKCFSKYQLGAYLPTIPVNKKYYYLNKQMDVSCLPYYNEKYQCYSHQTSKYRSIDGSCNNLNSPYWGRSFTCHIRLLPADYSDGIRSFRMAKSGGSLPNPRQVSNYVAISRDLKSFYTTLILAWGQFINHDLTNTEGHKSNPKYKIDCCEKPNTKCVAIPVVDKKDYLLSQFNTKCINFLRSSPCPLCQLGPREQLNTQTSFLDGSQIYGATAKDSASLRSFLKGQLLAYSDRNGNPVLPPDPGTQPCTPKRAGLSCFKAGDNRVNQHPLLLAMHTLLMRNHNHHAYKLSYVNPRWKDEQLFQEARRITIAEIQHITMNEYLPIIMGPLLMNYYRLNPLKGGGYTKYEPYTDPSSWNEFVSAASRYGHSQIKDFYRMKPSNYSLSYPALALKDNFFEPTYAWDGLLEDIVRGTLSETSNTIDPYYSHTAKNFIMRAKNKPHGLDLVTTNIQRGRDHGLPGYVHYLKACFNYQAKSWYDLEKFIPSETLSKLKTMYRDIEDIDLYIAGVSERHFIDASIGPTFGCLVGIQFNHAKFGDRYYYEHGGQSGSFTPAQLNNIKQTASMAKILCRTMRGYQKVQPRPFYLSSRYNQPKDCRRYPEINYLLWKQ